MTPAAKSSSPHLKPAVTQFFEAIKDWDFDAIEKLFSEDFIHTTLPASANDPPKNKKYGIEHAKAVAALLGNPHLDYEIFQWVEAAGSIWVHSSLYGEILGGRQFDSENIWIFKLNSKGDQIVAIQEFVDTVLAKEFRPAPRASSLRSSDRRL